MTEAEMAATLPTHFSMQKNVRLALVIILPLALALVGGITFLLFLGSENHVGALVSGTAVTAAINACGGKGHWLCVGLHTFGPFLRQLFGTYLAPFQWYIILSIALYAVVAATSFIREAKPVIRITVTPLLLVLSFVGSLWLLFTVLSTSYDGGQPLRLLVNQTHLQGADINEPGTAASILDYDDLKARSCMDVGTFENGIEAGLVTYSCIQQSFFARVMSQFCVILGLLLIILSVGRGLLRMCGVRPPSRATEAMFSAAAGAGAVIAILWLTATIGMYVSAVGWVLLLGLPTIFYRDVLHWLKEAVRAKIDISLPWYDARIILSWLLVSILALNFLSVIRPFPIGWDDLGVYLNQPKLLVSYGHATPKLSVFAWEYLTSLGFLLFGYDSTFGATNAMLINWMAGLLAVGVTFLVGRHWMNAKAGIMAALLYYLTPLVGHFSFADMKVDNAVYTFGALSLFTLLLFLAPKEEGSGKPNVRLLIFAGILAGLSFGFKATSIMVVMTLVVLLAGTSLSWLAGGGALLLTFAAFRLQGALNIQSIGARIFDNPAWTYEPFAFTALLIIGVACVGCSCWWRPERVRRAVTWIGLFSLGFLAAVAPWLTYNSVLYGKPGLWLGAPPGVLAPAFVVAKGQETPKAKVVRALPEDLRIDVSHLACKSTSRAEELDRYWGNHQGIMHYLGLPWRAVMNADSFGYYVTLFPALLLFPLLLLLPNFWRKEKRWLRLLTAATILMGVQWIFLANGLPWYGVAMFLGLCVGLAALVNEMPSRLLSSITTIFLILSLLSSLGFRLWQFAGQKNLLTYPMGVVSAHALEARTVGHYKEVRDIIVKRATPDRPYTLRFGTFIPYFIPRNIERLPISDNQLDWFTCLNQEENPALTLKRLQSLGFNAIIVDLNTATIEQDPQGSLHRKVQKFENFVNAPGLGIRLAVKDQQSGIAYLLLP